MGDCPLAGRRMITMCVREEDEMGGSKSLRSRSSAKIRWVI